MKKYFLLLILFCFFKTGHAQINIGPDKYKHFAAGAVIGGVGGYASHKIFQGDRKWTWVGAVGSSLAAGLVKETMDKNKYGVWENGDIVFTVLGGIVSGLVLDLFLKSDGRRRRGKPCSCYALQIKYSNPNNDFVNINIRENGSRDIISNLQAQAILVKHASILD